MHPAFPPINFASRQSETEGIVKEGNMADIGRIHNVMGSGVSRCCVTLITAKKGALSVAIVYFYRISKYEDRVNVSMY